MNASIPPRPDLGDLLPGRLKATWSWYVSIGVYLLAFLIAGVAQIPVLAAFGVLEETSSALTGPQAWATVLGDTVIAGVLIFWLAKWHRNWQETIGFSAAGKRSRDFGWGFAVGLGLYFAITIGVAFVLTVLFQAIFGREIASPDQISTADLSASSIVAFALLSLVAAPVSEELFFRGIFFRAIRDRYGFWPGAIGSGLLFGLIHYVPSAWESALLLQTTMVFTGVAWAWVYERRGTLLANIGAHVAFNTIGLTFYFAFR